MNFYNLINIKDIFFIEKKQYESKYQLLFKILNKSNSMNNLSDYNKKRIIKNLLSREKNNSTYNNKGYAIPHVVLDDSKESKTKLIIIKFDEEVEWDFSKRLSCVFIFLLGTNGILFQKFIARLSRIYSFSKNEIITSQDPEFFYRVIKNAEQQLYSSNELLSSLQSLKIEIYKNGFISNWKSFYCYIWNSSKQEYNVEWPGILLNQIHENLFFYDFQNIESANIVFNDGDLNQTVNLYSDRDGCFVPRSISDGRVSGNWQPLKLFSEKHLKTFRVPITINNPKGIHCRPSGEIFKYCLEIPGRIILDFNGRKSEFNNIVNIMNSGLYYKCKAVLICEISDYHYDIYIPKLVSIMEKVFIHK